MSTTDPASTSKPSTQQQVGRRQRRFLEALVWARASRVDAAKAAGVTLAAVTDWMREPGFVAALREEFRRLLDLQRVENLARLVRIADDENSDPDAVISATMEISRACNPLETGHDATERSDRPSSITTAPVTGLTTIYEGLPAPGESRLPMIDLSARKAAREARGLPEAIGWRLDVLEPVIGGDCLIVMIFGRHATSDQERTLLQTALLLKEGMTLAGTPIDRTLCLLEHWTALEFSLVLVGAPSTGLFRLSC